MSESRGVCKLELVRGEHDGEWVFRARKIVPPTFCTIASSRYGARALQAELRRGFLVEDWTAAAKLLDRLVNEGFATKRWANRRDRY